MHNSWAFRVDETNIEKIFEWLNSKDIKEIVPSETEHKVLSFEHDRYYYIRFENKQFNYGSKTCVGAFVREEDWVPTPETKEDLLALLVIAELQ